MYKHLLVLSIFFIAGLSSSAQQGQKTPDTTPPAGAGPQTSPVKPSADSIAQGKKVYGYDCAMCHGADGDGKGDLAVDMKLKIRDYRDSAALKSVSDGEMFYVIKNGKGQMPPEG